MYIATYTNSQARYLYEHVYMYIVSSVYLKFLNLCCVYSNRFCKDTCFFPAICKEHLWNSTVNKSPRGGHPETSPCSPYSLSGRFMLHVHVCSHSVGITWLLVSYANRSFNEKVVLHLLKGK